MAELSQPGDVSASRARAPRRREFGFGDLLNVSMSMYRLNMLLRAFSGEHLRYSEVLELRISRRLAELAEERYRLELALAVLKGE